jgi:eukaryotic-like serine/threonine-protein kinase
MSRPDLPRRFGRYALFDFVGKGGMAEIYLARAETEFGGSRLCVVKEILPQFATQERFAEMLVFEAKLAARLSHGNVVQVFDLGREEDRLFIAMEYVEGYDLNALLRICTKKRVALPLEYALLIVIESLRGLDYAHRREDDSGAPMGIVHRDVSPSNILISLEGEVKVCDFGIAHANAMVATSDQAWEEALRGKCGYMSPEHARGESLDARADVFAAGILLWELVAGKRMYRAPDMASLLALAQAGVTPELPDRGLPDSAMLERIAKKALAISRDERFESAGAMLRELESYAIQIGAQTSTLRFGEWLKSSFGTEVLSRRLEQEAILAPGASQQIAALNPEAAQALLSSVRAPLAKLVPVPAALEAPVPAVSNPEGPDPAQVSVAASAEPKLAEPEAAPTAQVAVIAEATEPATAKTLLKSLPNPAVAAASAPGPGQKNPMLLWLLVAAGAAVVFYLLTR